MRRSRTLNRLRICCAARSSTPCEGVSKHPEILQALTAVREGGLETLLTATGVFSRYGYVCASKTMALRRLLEAANQDMGFTNKEKGLFVCEALSVAPESDALRGRVNMSSDATEECRLVLLIRSGRVPQQAFPAPSGRASPQDKVTPRSHQFRPFPAFRQGQHLLVIQRLI